MYLPSISNKIVFLHCVLANSKIQDLTQIQTKREICAYLSPRSPTFASSWNLISVHKAMKHWMEIKKDRKNPHNIRVPSEYVKHDLLFPDWTLVKVIQILALVRFNSFTILKDSTQIQMNGKKNNGGIPFRFFNYVFYFPLLSFDFIHHFFYFSCNLMSVHQL